MTTKRRIKWIFEDRPLQVMTHCSFLCISFNTFYQKFTTILQLWYISYTMYEQYQQRVALICHENHVPQKDPSDHSVVQASMPLIELFIHS